MNKRKGFTFVELMVVMTIGAIIFAVTSVTYRSITINSRDARRKSDLEAVRQALELCRSYSGAYPAEDPAASNTLGTTIVCGGQTYMSEVPTDPKTQAEYYYNQSSASTYEVRTTMEDTSLNPYELHQP